MVKALRCAAAAAVWLLLWQLLYSVVGLSVLVPSPLEVLRELLRLGLEPAFWLSVLSSLGRVLSGFLLGCAAGTLLALLTSFSRWALDFFSPMLHVIKATPVASFIILALVWLRVSAIPVFTAFLIVCPPRGPTSPPVLPRPIRSCWRWHGLSASAGKAFCCKSICRPCGRI